MGRDSRLQGGRADVRDPLAAGRRAVRHVAFKPSLESFHLLTETGLFVPAPLLARAEWVATDDVEALSDAEWRGYLVRAKRRRDPLLTVAATRPGRR